MPDNRIGARACAHTPTLTIGMPVYNGATYICEALDSLLGQTFTDFELIISDNSSTDNTQSICEEYERRDLRIRYVRQNENKGALANFKFVLDSAKSELFMWAAYDDLWASNYLLEATALLSDGEIDFVFPSFELRSIRLGIAKQMDPQIFKFINFPERRWRVLHFMALHYLSHSANIVYSLYRTDFLKGAFATQDIGNDGALGAVVLGMGRGVMSDALFSKRYRTVWPGMLPPILNVINGWLHKRDVIGASRLAIRKAKLRMLSHFPEYASDIEFIFGHYFPYEHDQHYRVCSVCDLF